MYHSTVLDVHLLNWVSLFTDMLLQGLFLAWVVRPEMMQIAVWLAWFAVLGFLKVIVAPLCKIVPCAS